MKRALESKGGEWKVESEEAKEESRRLFRTCIRPSSLIVQVTAASDRMAQLVLARQIGGRPPLATSAATYEWITG